MNLKHLDLLIQTLERAEPETFTMESVFQKDGQDTDLVVVRGCGTAACIAGWCGWIKGRKRGLWDSGDARRWLSLKARTAEALFMPSGFDMHPEQFPLDRALDVLKHMRHNFVTTGEEVVCWENFPLHLYGKPGRLADVDFLSDVG